MTKTVAGIKRFLQQPDSALPASGDTEARLNTLACTQSFKDLLLTLIESDAFSPELGKEFAAAGAVPGISACRMLRGALNLSLDQFFQLLAQLLSAFTPLGQTNTRWSKFADQIHRDKQLSKLKLLTYLTKTLADAEANNFYTALAEQLITSNPHAVYPTSPYRECDGFVESTSDHQTVEAVMSFSTFSSIRTIDHSIDIAQTALRDIYRPLGRCICLVDENVQALHGETIAAYFAHHGIALHRLIYRAMEIDKGIATVERMLGDFKKLGVARNEPVLIVGGGVLADTGGLACALYGRNTPYVMLATSIVTGIDAGPSPRTCCDGFGYKNLLGAYHPPIVSITDRFFFKTLREGWLRHGVAEIIKMAIVADIQLFEDLEAAQPRLIDTRFGTVACEPEEPIHALSQKILSRALRAYIAAEYDNLYETHQCRPHAYGHTWSPGFEIEPGLLHGHAVAICMGLGAYISFQRKWITEEECHRILTLMSGYGLSLWHDVLKNRGTMRESHRKIVQKRGGNLVAPLPKGAIGQCGYLNDLSEEELFHFIDGYETVCKHYVRGGTGIDPLCTDVGLEDPGAVIKLEQLDPVA